MDPTSDTLGANFRPTDQLPGNLRWIWQPAGRCQLVFQVVVFETPISGLQPLKMKETWVPMVVTITSMDTLVVDSPTSQNPGNIYPKITFRDLALALALPQLRGGYRVWCCWYLHVG